jgi:hypothetical protein
MVPCKVSNTGWKYVTQDQLDKINIHKGERFGKFVPPPSNLNQVVQSSNLSKRDYDDPVERFRNKE